MSFERKQLKPVTVRNGLRFSPTGAPAQIVDENKPATAAALVGADYPGMRPKFLVEVDEKVHQGQTLFVDRKDEAICFVSPISGQILSMDYGPRRTLAALVVRAQTDQTDTASPTESPSDEAALDGTSRQSVRESLLARGLWPAFRSRPFGTIPRSDGTPSAIMVSAIDLAPGAVDPDPVIAANEKAFGHGLEILTKLTDGMVFVCQAKASTVRIPEHVNIQAAFFEGSYQAGLASTHIYRLAPASRTTPVWTVGYQDVIAIGTLFQTGHFDGMRVISLSGAPLNKPRLVRAPLGAGIQGLLNGELKADHRTNNGIRTLSGSAASGREAAYLSRYHTQISVLAHQRRGERPKWTSRLPFFGLNAVSPLVPNTMLDGTLPANVLAVPLMRALSVGDAQAAKQLGVLDLVEEDVAALNLMCTSGADYRLLLRSVLNELAEEEA